MPSWAARWMVSRFEQATQSGGCGFCTGFGTTLRTGIEKYLPWKPGYGSIASMFATCSTVFAPHRAALRRVDVEAFEFGAGRGFAGAELDAAVRDEVERGDALGDARGRVVVRRHEVDAVAQADVLRALASSREEHLRCGGVRVLLEEVVLDFPGEVDAQLVGQLDLGERVLEQLELRAFDPRPRDWCS